MFRSAVFRDNLVTKSPIEFLDRYPFLPIVLLVIFPPLLQVPFWLLGLSTDPMGYYSYIVHGAQVVPGLPYLDPNVGVTTQALGHLAAWDWVHGIIPWWNPYTGIGVPLAGELQPEAFFLPFNLLLFFQEGILWQRLTMQILAGLATYALLRELGLSRLASFLGGALFSVNGVIALVPGPAAVYCSSPFLPCLLWGIERARKPRQGAQSILAVGCAIAWMILAGFPEPAYIGGLLALAWGIYRLRSASDRKAILRRTLGGFALGLMVTAPLLIAFLDYLLQSDSFNAHIETAISKPWSLLPAMFSPYIYGPLNFPYSISNSLVSKSSSTGGYIGPLVLVMAVVGLARKSTDRGLRILLLLWVFICWARSFSLQPIKTILDHLPLLNRAMFYRYSGASWILALIILAAYGLDAFREATPRRRYGFMTVILLLSICVALAWPLRSFWAWSHGEQSIMFVFLSVSVVWSAAMLCALWLAWRIPDPEWQRTALATLLVFDAAVMFLGAQASARRNDYVDVQAMQFLREHQGLSRLYTLFSPAPNYNAFFHVASINHNILPVPKLWADYMKVHLLPEPPDDFGTTFYWPGWGDAKETGPRMFNGNLASFREVGVRYVVTAPGQSALPLIYADPADANLSLDPAVPVPSAAPKAILRLQALVADRGKPALERWVLGKVAGEAAHVVALLRTPAGANNQRNAGLPLANGFTLPPGATKETMFPMPKLSDQNTIASVSVLITNSSTVSNGMLQAEICGEQGCSQGQVPLSGSTNGSFLEIPLDGPFPAEPNSQVRLKLTHQGGDAPLALITSPGANSQLHLALRESMTARGFRKVYSDSMMNIWELPGEPAPYYEVVQGGPCVLTAMRREGVVATCSSPATLRRRELYMPGWKASGQAVQQAGIFQSTALPQGASALRFTFTPPYVLWGWIVCLFGTAGLLWQAVRIGLRRKDD